MSNDVEALTRAIAEARATLTATRIVGPHHFLLTALVGYLWNAIATADTLLVVIKSGVGRGAGPLPRVFHESYLDAMFLTSDSDGDFLAARCFLSSYRNTLALIGDYRQVVASHPESNLPPVPPDFAYFDRPPLDFIRGLDEQNVTYGGGKDLFTRAWDWWKKPPYWHWSGLSRRRMVESLIERGKLDGRTAFIALSLTDIYNTKAHAGPPWGELPPSEDGSTAPPPLRSSDEDLAQFALAGVQLLEGLSREVKEFFALKAVK